MPKLKSYTDAEFKRAVIAKLNLLEKKIDAIKPDFLKDEEKKKHDEYLNKTFKKYLAS